MAIELKDLLEAGVHFGHQTKRWNPKMKPFIFTARNGIYIIDLRKTLLSLNAACRKAREVAAEGKPILFVGTKKQAKGVIAEESQRANQFCITERWMGGMLTNFTTIRQSIKRLRDMERMREDGTYEKITKKERLKIDKEIDKLELVLGGIKDMGRLPGLVYVVDARKERIAVSEARKLGIPIIGVVDTNCDPDPIDFPVAGNDDAIKSISLLTHEVSSAIIEGMSAFQKEGMAASKGDEDEGDDKLIAAMAEDDVPEGSEPVKP
ncbi:MAG: 30S ribosomal protein S2 [candidate division Zixibacteria bacterium]|nr:30S ribosomal protein S2 [candidate division Zixibacteria bacterium]